MFRKIKANGFIILYRVTEYTFQLGEEIDAYLDFESQGYGWTYARTEYYKETDVSNLYDYYTGYYWVSTHPNNGSYCSGLDVKSEMSSGNMKKYGPFTTPINYTYSVSASGTFSDTPGVTVGESWQYTIYDTSYNDQAVVGTNTLDIRTDISEGTSTGSGTCNVIPGKLVRINDGGTYVSYDTYKAQFCHHYFFGFGAYNDTPSGRNVKNVIYP